MPTQKEKPIIFSSQMVRAILENRKSQTRRPIKKRVENIGDIYYLFGDRLQKCPYGQPGDHLWVRENYWIPSKIDEQFGIQFDADVTDADLKNAKRDLIPLGWKHKPSIFMPRWVSRITLEITNIRVERLQEITEEDALKEGVKHHESGIMSMAVGYRASFKDIWNSIYGKDAWDKNPLCWVIEFIRK